MKVQVPTKKVETEIVEMVGCFKGHHGGYVYLTNDRVIGVYYHEKNKNYSIVISEWIATEGKLIPITKAEFMAAYEIANEAITHELSDLYNGNDKVQSIQEERKGAFTLPKNEPLNMIDLAGNLTGFPTGENDHLTNLENV